MLKKLEKFEDSLNKLLTKLISLWFVLLHKILPEKVFTIVEQTKQKMRQSIADLKEWIINSAILIFTKAKEYWSQFMAWKNKVLAIDFGGIIKAKLLGLKEFLLKTPFKSQVKLSTSIANKLAPYMEKFSKKIQRYSSDQIWIIAVAFLMVSSGIFGVYLSSKEIYQKEFPNRAPASVQEYDDRPEYRLYKRKTVSFQSIKVPITVENVSDITSITIDLSVRTSTRWARYYLENYETQLKDYFFTTVEPVVSDFPLEQEGKEILKEKVRVEINNFLREHGVEGEVDDVRILFIVAS